MYDCIYPDKCAKTGEADLQSHFQVQCVISCKNYFSHQMYEENFNFLIAKFPTNGCGNWNYVEIVKSEVLDFVLMLHHTPKWKLLVYWQTCQDFQLWAFKKMNQNMKQKQDLTTYVLNDKVLFSTE